MAFTRNECRIFAASGPSLAGLSPLAEISDENTEERVEQGLVRHVWPVLTTPHGRPSLAAAGRGTVCLQHPRSTSHPCQGRTFETVQNHRRNQASIGFKVRPPLWN